MNQKEEVAEIISVQEAPSNTAYILFNVFDRIALYIFLTFVIYFSLSSLDLWRQHETHIEMKLRHSVFRHYYD